MKIAFGGGGMKMGNRGNKSHVANYIILFPNAIFSLGMSLSEANMGTAQREKRF